MKKIAFIDTESGLENNEVLDIGAIKVIGEIFHSNNIRQFHRFIKNAEFICGYDYILLLLKNLKINR